MQMVVIFELLKLLPLSMLSILKKFMVYTLNIATISQGICNKLHIKIHYL